MAGDREAQKQQTGTKWVFFFFFFGRTGARGGLEVRGYRLFKKWRVAKMADKEGQRENGEDIAQ